MSLVAESWVSRDHQREQTRARIADAARRSFAADGYDRTTIRRIAADAGVDPALVLHYFGSKRDLFATVIRLPIDGTRETLASLGSPSDDVLTSLSVKLGGMNDQTLAGLRSMLTHPDATAHARDTLTQEARALASELTGEQADVRAALLLAFNLGVSIARELLELEALRSCQPDELLRLLAPAVQALSEPSQAVIRPGATGEDESR